MEVYTTSPACGPRKREAAGFAAALVKPVRQSPLLDTLATLWAAELAGAPRPLVLSARAARRASAAAAPVGRPGLRVLLAEDNAVNQRVATLMLEELGCRVDVAANGREAVDMVERFPYDLVLMDCQMPELDGYGATGAIRQREGEGRRLPIVAMTAHALAGDRERCLAAGMDDYVAKPVRPDALAAVLARWGPGAARESDAARGADAETVATLDAAPGTAPPPGAPDSPPLDPVVVVRLRYLGQKAGSGFLGELVSTFRGSAAEALTALRAAVAAGDAAAVARAAHTLKGASGSVGAEAVAALCRELEALGGVSV